MTSAYTANYLDHVKISSEEKSDLFEYYEEKRFYRVAQHMCKQLTKVLDLLLIRF